MALGKNYRVLEKLSSSNPYSILIEKRGEDSALLFESKTIAVLTLDEKASLLKNYNKLLDAYGCMGVLEFRSGEDLHQYLVMVTGCLSIGKILESEIFRVTRTHFIPLTYQGNDEEKLIEVKKFLNSGAFYFSWSSLNTPIDLTLCAQRQKKSYCSDHRFFWNKLLHVSLEKFNINCDEWLLKTICGSVDIRTIYSGAKQAKAVIVSRLSCERSGTRFNVRGINDNGCVANFVETEQAIYVGNQVTSFVQVRGSVPLFWEQPGVQVGSHKIKISRCIGASVPAFNKHLNALKKYYGKIVLVNLLGSDLSGSREGEASLSHLYQKLQCSSMHQDVPHIIFDYHHECRSNVNNSLKLLEKVSSYLKEFSFFSCDESGENREQKGSLRMNCLDCLDRTNGCQCVVALSVLQSQLKALLLDDKPQSVTRFEETFKQMWVNNGNEVSRIYSGTGAIQGGSKLMDGARSAARTIQGNLLDGSKQEAIELLLGTVSNSDLIDKVWTLLPSNLHQVSRSVLYQMYGQSALYSSPMNMKVGVGTYNVNGGKQFRSVVFKDVSLSDWLLDFRNSQNADSLVNVPSYSDQDVPIDIYAIGFEEIVDLNAGNIMAASSTNANAWAEELQKVLNRDQEYILITYVQLVGVCLYIFCLPRHLKYVRDVATDSVKTGLGGATGNKGAVAVRLVIYNTSICFVCAHFAAGQSQIPERNSDFAEISRKINFPPGRSLNTHDYVFWCGDFNYRVDLEKNELKNLISQKKYMDVLKHDQLLKQKAEGNVFVDYSEGAISFPPTYKYDLFSDDYDTSEKCRTPAWTDRILWKRNFFTESSTQRKNQGRILYYGRAELKQSDHRPVFAVIDVEITKVDYNRLYEVFIEILSNLGPPDASVVIQFEDSSLPCDETHLDDETVMLLVKQLSSVGEIVLIRFIDEGVLITFQESPSAVKALKLHSKLQMNGYKFKLSLRSPNWRKQIFKEIVLRSNNYSLTERDVLNPSAGMLNNFDEKEFLDYLRKTNDQYEELDFPPSKTDSCSMRPATYNVSLPRTHDISSEVTLPLGPPPVPPRTIPPPVPARSSVR